MAPVRPMLDNLELQYVQEIVVDAKQVLVHHGVPALEGDFLQGLGRRAACIALSGVITGTDAGSGLKDLREKFRSAEPVSFVADINTATKVDKVIIEEMVVRELAGKPERFEYAFTLKEYTPLPPAASEVPPKPDVPKPPDDNIDKKVGTLKVEVIVEGQKDFDYSHVVVTVEGTQQDGTALSRTLANRTADIWNEEEFPAGDYTVKALANSQPMSGSAKTSVQSGQTANVTIPLKAVSSNIAKAFIVHFWFDRAFVEPCMKQVLQTVAKYASDHPDEKLVIVGHTDLAGSPDYNQSLSERRARAVYACMIAGRDRDNAIKEWNELRRRATGKLPSINDSWSTREYQYILQDLDHYRGNIDEQHGPKTSAAVRSFQKFHNLPETGVVDDATWPELIGDYLDLDALAIPESQFLKNSKDGCDGGILKWLGCGEQDPVKNTQDAWRPNRRTELLFVKADKIPCEVAKPVTFDLPTPGVVGSTWCLGPGDANKRCCFISRDKEQPNKFLIQPGEPGKTKASGSITFDDGTPVANAKYALIAPDGEYLHTDSSGKPDLGERPQGSLHGRPIPNRADENGNFSYPRETPVGIYIIELIDLKDPQVARKADDPKEDAVGNVICMRLSLPITASAIGEVRAGAGPAKLNTKVQSGPVPPVTVNPVITLASSVVVVKKTHTDPARVLVTLSTSSSFRRSGTLTRASSTTTPTIRLFTAAKGGTEITFKNKDNVFSGPRMSKGVQLFAEAANPSPKIDDFELTLTLNPGPTTGAPATSRMTAVELTLDIGLSRLAPGVTPPLMPVNEKVAIGRIVQVRNPRFAHERAMIIIRPPNPAIPLTVTLSTIGGRLQVFGFEVPAEGQPPQPDPLTLPSFILQPDGFILFVEGTSASTAIRDTGLRLGIEGSEKEADRVAITTVQIEAVNVPNAAAPATSFVRFGLWDNAFDPVTGNVRNGVIENQNFIGSDSRRFFFRLRDPSRAGTATLRWRTAFANDTNDDAPAPPAESQDLTLNETSIGSGVFISKAVLLVTDDVDSKQETDSGLTTGDVGLRKRGQSNHRIRRMTVDNAHQLDGKVVAEYTSTGVGIRPLTTPIQVFNRKPEERKRLRVHLVSVRKSAGGDGLLKADRKDRATKLFQSLYAVCGIYADVDQNEILIDPPASCLAWPGVYPGNAAFLTGPVVEGFGFQAGNLVPSASQLDIINVVRSRPSFNPNDIYVVFINRIINRPLPTPPVVVPPAPAPAVVFQTDGGESFPDSFTLNNSVARGFTFVSVITGSNNVEVHEVTHITTNLKNAAGGHYDLGLPSTTVPPPTAPGNIDGKNLMHRFGPVITSSVTDPKRLWDTQVTNSHYSPVLVIPPQIDAIRKSRFVHDF